MKTCTKCGVEKPATAEFFFRRSDRPCGLIAACKTCKMKAADDYWQKREGGRQGKDRRYREQHPAACRAKDRRYWEQHKDQKRAANRQFWVRRGGSGLYQKEKRQNNLELHRKYDRLRFLRDREKRLAWSAAWQKRNPEKGRVYAERHRALKLVGGGQVTEQDIEKKWDIQGGRCFYCHDMLTRSFHLEHKVPLVKGGAHSPENTCLACRRCNARKGTATAEQFMARLAKESA